MKEKCKKTRIQKIEHMEDRTERHAFESWNHDFYVVVGKHCRTENA